MALFHPVSSSNPVVPAFSPAQDPQESAPPPVAALSPDVLCLIFHLASEGMESKEGMQTLCTIRKVCTSWRHVVEETILKPNWARLAIEIANPSLRTCVREINCADQLVHDVIAAALSHAHPYDPPDIDSLPGTSYFERFHRLTGKLTSLVEPSFRKFYVAGFKTKNYQHLFDQALKTLWKKTTEQMDFQQSNMPREAKEIRLWLNDRANAKKIAQITKIKLNGFKLSILPPEIGHFTHLSKLNLAQNKLHVLPPEIGNLVQLKELTLTCNQLSTLPSEIGNLVQLEELYLGHNDLTALPSEIGRLSQLRLCFLHSNALKTLPPEMGNLYLLHHLSLGGNEITSLPAEIGNLRNLYTLGLEDNQLTTLPLEIERLTYLEQLYLYQNPLICILNENLQDTHYSVGMFRHVSPKKINLRALMKSYLDCINVSCHSPLASLCQGILRGADSRLLHPQFDLLSSEMKQTIIDHSTPNQDLFADRAKFANIVIFVAKSKLTGFSENARRQIRQQTRDVEEEGCRSLTGYNIIALIDAMESIQKGL